MPVPMWTELIVPVRPIGECWSWPFLVVCNRCAHVFCSRWFVPGYTDILNWKKTLSSCRVAEHTCFCSRSERTKAERCTSGPVPLGKVGGWEWSGIAPGTSCVHQSQNTIWHWRGDWRFKGDTVYGPCGAATRCIRGWSQNSFSLSAATCKCSGFIHVTNEGKWSVSAHRNVNMMVDTAKRSFGISLVHVQSLYWLRQRFWSGMSHAAQQNFPGPTPACS